MKILLSVLYGILLGPILFAAWIIASPPWLYLFELINAAALALFVWPLICTALILAKWKSISISGRTILISSMLSATLVWHYTWNVANVKKQEFRPITNEAKQLQNKAN